MRLNSVLPKVPALFVVLLVVLAGNGHHVFGRGGATKSLEINIIFGVSRLDL